MRGVAVLAERAYPGQDVVQSAEKLWTHYGLTVRRDLPAILTQIRNANLEVDPLLDMLRGSGGPTDTQTFGQSLVPFLRSLGGLLPVGETLDMEKERGLPGEKRLISESGRSLDDAAMLAAEAGFFNPALNGQVTETELIEAIRNELGGSPLFSMLQTDERLMGVQAQLSGLNQAIKDAGIDLNAVTDNAEVRRLLQQSGPVVGVRFEQPRQVSGSVADSVAEMLAAAPVVVDTSALAGKHGQELRDAARTLYPDNETETNAKSGEVVRFVVRGFREMKYHSGDERVMRIVPSLRALLHEATPLWTNVDDGTHPGVRLWHNFGVKASIDGQEVIVRLAAREMGNGEIDLLHYDSDVRTVAEVEKAMAGRLFDPNQNHPSATATGVSTSKDSLAQWLAGVNPADPAATHYRTYQQKVGAGETARGYLQIGPEGKMRLGLTENANLSTFLHETGHFYLELLGDLAGDTSASDQVRADYASILRWFGVERRDQIEVKHHEMFGRVESQSFGTATTAPAINLLRIEESLSAAHLRLASGTTVENLPWADCLARYDRAHTFFYSDPPYWQTEGYGVPFPFDEYLAMASAMRSCKGKVMVSINDHPQIREAFAGLPMLDLEITYTVGTADSRKSSRELVIMNWEQQDLGQLF